jgi:hypothetical protein
MEGANMPRDKEYEAELQRRLTVFQSRYDQVLEAFGRRAPAPKMGQGANSYQREGLGYIQQFVHPQSPWRNVSLDGLMADALVVVSKEIINDAMACARDPRLIAQTPAAKSDPMDSSIKMIERTLAGKKVTEFHGDTSFVVAMSRPGRKVISFMHNPNLMPQR